MNNQLNPHVSPSPNKVAPFSRNSPMETPRAPVLTTAIPIDKMNSTLNAYFISSEFRVSGGRIYLEKPRFCANTLGASSERQIEVWVFGFFRFYNGREFNNNVYDEAFSRYKKVVQVLGSRRNTSVICSRSQNERAEFTVQLLLYNKHCHP